jgi:catechol 2,3-dioxygenase-like lactoylglutathione lyase family enzyme
MPVIGLDHINIRTTDPAATLAFFSEVLGMAAVHPGGAGSSGDGGWILDGSGAAIVHVARADQVFPGDINRPFTPSRGSGAIDHVALRCSDHAAMKAHLTERGLAFWENEVPRARLRQIFLEEPTGILFELGFTAAPAA